MRSYGFLYGCRNWDKPALLPTFRIAGFHTGWHRAYRTRSSWRGLLGVLDPWVRQEAARSKVTSWRAASKRTPAFSERRAPRSAANEIMSRRISASGVFSTSVRRFIMSSVTGLTRGWTVVANPSLARRTINGHRHHPGCYRAVEGAQQGRWLQSATPFPGLHPWSGLTRS